MNGQRPSLARRLMAAQTLVIGAGAAALIGSAVIVGPGLFHHHLAETGEDSPTVLQHAEQAFATSFAISLLVATGVSLVAAFLVSWFIVRRVAHPVEELADAAETLASGRFDVSVPVDPFSSEIERLTDAFERMAHKLADSETSRSSLLSDLAHELRTPLATLEAYVDGLEDGVVAGDAPSYATMREQIERLRRLSGDLREVALAEEHALGIHLEPTSLNHIVSGSVAAARPRYEAAGVALSLELSPWEVTVDADAVRLQQVLSNLLDNALRHSPGGAVSVRMSEDRDGAWVAVSDNGEGIPDDQLESVFQRFHRVDSSRRSLDGSGSGLGLTIARAIVTDHRGSLVADSQGAGLGATFTFTIPLAEGRPATAKGATAGQPANS